MAVMCAVVEHGTDHLDAIPEHCPQLSSPEAVVARLETLKAPVAVFMKHRVPSTPNMPKTDPSVAKTISTSSSNKRKGKSMIGSPRSATAHAETISIACGNNKNKKRNKSSRRIREIAQREEDLDMVVCDEHMNNVFDDCDNGDELDARLSGSFHLLMNLTN